MNETHPVPQTTIATGPATIEARGLMLQHREEARRLFVSALRGGLSDREALAKAARPIRAARRAQVMYRAELAHVSAGAELR